MTSDKFQKEAMRTNRELAAENDKLREENRRLNGLWDKARERLAAHNEWFAQLGKFLNLDQFEIRNSYDDRQEN